MIKYNWQSKHMSWLINIFADWTLIWPDLKAKSKMELRQGPCLHKSKTLHPQLIKEDANEIRSHLKRSKAPKLKKKDTRSAHPVLPGRNKNRKFNSSQSKLLQVVLLEKCWTCRLIQTSQRIAFATKSPMAR